MLRLIVIFAHWCPKCNMMTPIIEEVAADYVDRMQTTWIDVEQHPEAYEEYEVDIVPTLIFFCDEREVARMAGMIGETNLRERIEKNTCISPQSVI